MKILIIEDDPKIASFLEKGFRENGFVVESAQDGMAGLDLALVNEFDVGVFDIMLPGLDGLSILDKMRAEKVEFPVILLSALGSVNDRIEGLRRGGDDYVTKPFSFSELLARVHVVARRGNSTAEKTDLLRFGDLELEPWKHEARRGGELIQLHPREFALLELFLRNPERVISKTMILENVYDYSFDPQTNVVDVLVHRLRKKIDEGFGEKLIHTLRGMGYVLKKPA